MLLRVNLKPTQILPVQTLYSVLYNYRCHTIVDCITLDILLLNCLYLINWHYVLLERGLTYPVRNIRHKRLPWIISLGNTHFFGLQKSQHFLNIKLSN